ncbi:GNAT family N-acetyltransferase [Priestia koreensis]|uniref:GNAT family N-acetyltransferase n=1 Tax=Priestia koreensis TaxID=284581 RepID=UPI001F57B7E5|nr:GNAT family N-acetyltransferase [Priestia koreensis]MCM3005162.1 GNAT family N-acetyltransferase [Priestia koreensis]UNL83148.1 GNAT family N-acetyltransferase [Priestia koreensis]
MQIRRAEKTDAKGIANVHVDSWRTTYKGIIPDGFLDRLSYDQRTSLWENNLSKDDDYTFVAANESGEVIGFGSCGKRDRNHVENAGDLTSIYLLESHQGQGIGKKLLKELLQQCQRVGFHQVFVEVLEDNHTRYFYEHYGAQLIKTETITIGGKELSLLIYEWPNVNDVAW